MVEKIERYLQRHRLKLVPHKKELEAVKLLVEAREEIYRLREAILVQLCETEDSENMTGAQRDQFARDALSPNGEMSGAITQGEA